MSSALQVQKRILAPLGMEWQPLGMVVSCCVGAENWIWVLVQERKASEPSLQPACFFSSFVIKARDTRHLHDRLSQQHLVGFFGVNNLVQDSYRLQFHKWDQGFHRVETGNYTNGFSVNANVFYMYACACVCPCMWVSSSIAFYCILVRKIVSWSQELVCLSRFVWTVSPCHSFLPERLCTPHRPPPDHYTWLSF